ncbi:hypothetical protein DKM44_08970 [Deinococcus irradiatisoli]|uniref:Uncharacterized protein n=1 Tax=Deinococcus irradiatisoli TaxID=2202254 RepID=A0A2Z3JE78_9DEIO|nr:hypothetical protein [Deinococcus irradiatisoli]AWN23342.1 hypothetical protein DKM44_08970 [Deinococcus irradiatisoli]
MTLTDPTPTVRSTRFWLRLPSQSALYLLSTDHYPWSEVLSDLEQRPSLSAVLEAQQGAQRGRVVWQGGTLLGGFDAERDLSLAEFMRAFPRATLRLSVLETVMAQLLWQCRGSQPQTAPQPWPAAQGFLSERKFSGLVLGGEQGASVSCWQLGKPVAGTLPESGKVYILVAPQQLDLTSLVTFWSQVLAQASVQAASFPEVWRGAAAELAFEHPCLDPFAREIWLEGAWVRVQEDLDLAEVRDALLAAFSATLRKLKLPLQSLALAALQASPAWSASGAGELL